VDVEHDGAAIDTDDDRDEVHLAGHQARELAGRRKQHAHTSNVGNRRVEHGSLRRMDDLIEALAARRGHFLLESGHHGELWLDLDALFARPARVAPFVAELASRLSARGAEVVCGPLVGGAFVAQAVAAQLDVECSWTECVAESSGDGLYATRYRVPDALRDRLRRRTVAIVDDVINAGSATRATLADLRACGARVVAVGALLVLGSRAAELAAAEGLVLESVAALDNTLWEPEQCPLCAAGVALDSRTAA
jgi:orotate phosphoribosyltransferase